MKFFIKRKSEMFYNSIRRSAFLLMSAFAICNPIGIFANEKTGKTENIQAVKAYTARSVFEDIHTSALEILPKSIRLDMLDYWDADSVYKASNMMEGLSWLEEVSDSFLKVRITPVSTLEIKLLPVKDGNIVMTVYTVGDDVQAQDSQVTFYDSDLTELNTARFYEMPKLKEFFSIPKGSATKMKEIEDMIPFPTVALNANAENNNLEARLTVEKYVNEDDWNIARLFVKPCIILDWDKAKYRIKK